MPLKRERSFEVAFFLGVSIIARYAIALSAAVRLIRPELKFSGFASSGAGYLL